MAANPQWLRSSLCEDLAEIDRKAGRIPHTPSIEQIVDTDIRIWQAHMREAKPQYSKGPQRRAEHSRHQMAKQRAKEIGEQMGMNVRLDVKRKVEDDVRQPCPCGGRMCHYCKLRLRIAALMQPVPESEKDPRVSLSEAWKNCKYPLYAKELIDLTFWQQTPRAIALKHKGELQKVLVRKLEDIADRSTAIIGLGPWR